MSNNYFRFKQFTVEHTRCAMKVGTDGVLLGAWARGGDTILDIGTGSGLIALFMAQRYPSGKIVAIDVDAGAVVQARINVSNSAFSDRITIIEKPLQEFCAGQFGSIVCNPPFFVNSLKNRDWQKAMARHADTLTHAELVSGASRLLADDGEFSVVIPAALRTAIDAEAAWQVFSLQGSVPLEPYHVSPSAVIFWHIVSILQTGLNKQKNVLIMMICRGQNGTAA
mgnify:CR=1 FL=1